MPRSQSEFLEELARLMPAAAKEEYNTVEEKEENAIAANKVFQLKSNLLKKVFANKDLLEICRIAGDFSLASDRIDKDETIAKLSELIMNALRKYDPTVDERVNSQARGDSLVEFTLATNECRKLDENKKKEVDAYVAEEISKYLSTRLSPNEMLPTELAKIGSFNKITEYPDSPKTKLDLLRDSDKHPINEKVAELKTKPEVATNKELMDALDVANEYYSLPEETGFDLEYTEQTASIASFAAMDTSRALFDEKGFGRANFKATGNPDFIGTDGKFFEVINGSTNSLWSFPGDEKQAIRNLFNSVTAFKSQFVQNGDNRELPYIFYGQCLKVDQLVSADNLNPEAIITESKNLKDLHDGMEQLVDAAYNINPKRVLISNNSWSRTSVPANLRLKYIGATRIRGIEQSIELFERSGVTLDEFLEEPMQTTMKIYKEIYKAPVEKINSQVDYILGLATHDNAEVMMDYVNVSTDFGSMQRGLEGLFTLIKNDDVRKQLQADYAAFFFTAATKTPNMSDAFSPRYEATNISNLLIVEKEDMDLRKLNSSCLGGYDPVDNTLIQAFNPEDYLLRRKTSPSAIIQRMLDLNERAANNNMVDQGLLDEAFRDVATKILPVVERRGTKINQRVTKLISEGRINELTELDKEMIKLGADAAKVIREGTIGENKRAICERFAALKREHDGRNFLQRWFGSETGRIDDFLTALKNNLATVGVTADELAHPENIQAEAPVQNNDQANVPAREPAPVPENELEVAAPQAENNGPVQNAPEQQLENPEMNNNQ